jgi:hypothetical protein
VSGSLGDPAAGFQPLRWRSRVLGMALDFLYGFAIMILAGGGLVALALIR